MLLSTRTLSRSAHFLGAQATLAREAGLSRQHLAMILRGNANPSPATLLKLSRAATRLVRDRQRQEAARETMLAALRSLNRTLGLRPLAARIGLTPAGLSRILTGSRSPSPATLAKIRQAVAELATAVPDQPLAPPISPA